MRYRDSRSREVVARSRCYGLNPFVCGRDSSKVTFGEKDKSCNGNVEVGMFMSPVGVTQA